MAQAIGGQAVLEGVMMRGPRNWAVAVRKPDGEIAQLAREVDPLMARHWALRLPVVRGVIALGESLAIGFRALAISAQYAAQEEGEDGEVDTELSRGALIFAFAIAIGFALMVLVWLANVILSIMAAIAVSKGENYRYPFALRLIS